MEGNMSQSSFSSGYIYGLDNRSCFVTSFLIGRRIETFLAHAVAVKKSFDHW